VRFGLVDNHLVSRSEDRGIIDTSSLRMREATIVAGVWLTFLLGGFGELYVVLTWQRPNRPALAALFGMAVLAGVGVWLLPRERIVRSRYREAFFLSWSLLDFALIVLGTLADGGTASPLVLIFFVPVVFSAMSYPLGSVVAVGGLSVVSYLALAATVGGSSWSYQVAFAVVLACTSAMSAWQARNHNRQRETLAAVSRADPLTGCLNRRGFEERAMAEISAAVRQSRQGAVMVLDLDHFKPVNSHRGRPIPSRTSLSSRNAIRGRYGFHRFVGLSPFALKAKAGATDDREVATPMKPAQLLSHRDPRKRNEEMQAP
jgi:hypothetical protein